MRTLARLEGIVTDPVYTGKALAALMALCKKGELDAGKPVIFVHTGGMGALPAYAKAL
ncbi:MAG: pyridoxal-phosphate dependent enzyme [Gammaproteobacteria bacterium]|nr:pyridoxal-phosphate dependent enzyme [Gammaproteobacteria bacterium]